MYCAPLPEKELLINGRRMSKYCFVKKKKREREKERHKGNELKKQKKKKKGQNEIEN